MAERYKRTGDLECRAYGEAQASAASWRTSSTPRARRVGAGDAAGASGRSLAPCRRSRRAHRQRPAGRVGRVGVPRRGGRRACDYAAPHRTVPGGAVVRYVEALRDWTRGDVRLLTVRDEGYPLNLREVYNRPPFLFARGQLMPEDSRAVAVVGSGQASARGRQQAHELAGRLAERGVTVVSGLALGIDAAAHEGALETGGPRWRCSAPGSGSRSTRRRTGGWPSASSPAGRACPSSGRTRRRRSRRSRCATSSPAGSRWGPWWWKRTGAVGRRRDRSHLVAAGQRCIPICPSPEVGRRIEERRPIAIWRRQTTASGWSIRSTGCECCSSMTCSRPAPAAQSAASALIPAVRSTVCASATAPMPAR